jgi:hypothetical protein
MFRLTTDEIAAYGAVTGTLALAITFVGRRDITWSRRSKLASGDLRNSLLQLRDAATAARSTGAAALRTPRVRGDLEIVGEMVSRSPDRQLRGLLRSARDKCAIAASGGTDAFTEQAAIDQALESINAAITRIYKIERKAPK